MCVDVRLQQLEQWLAECLPAVFASQGWGEVPAAHLVAASSDASFRRYFRWQAEGRSLIVMDAPPPRENCQPFVQVAGLLEQAGVHVPQILAEDLPRGFLLLSDLGRQTYLEVIEPDNAESLFDDAHRALLAFQALDVEAQLPAYDDALLRRELQLFPEWYLQHARGITLTPAQQASWEAICQVLIDSALQQPRVLVHRDYMPRNLMLSQPNPGVLDFQDAVWGPVTYDITSLYKDAFVSWDEAFVEQRLAAYWQAARSAGIAVQDDLAQFLRASDLMGVQRHLKVIGIFARICHRDGKPRYLEDVPRFFAYIAPVLRRRPELAGLEALLAELNLELPA